MKDFSGVGLFWLDGADDEKVSGTITFTQADGVRLELIGAFGGMEGSFGASRRDETVRIHGVAGKKFLTLLNATQAGFSLNAPGIVQENYRADMLVTGANLTTEHELEFASVLVRLTHMPMWISRSGVSITIEAPGEDEPPNRWLYDFRPLEPERAELEDGGELEVGSSYAIGGDNLTESYIRQGTYFEVTPAAPLGIEDIFETVGSLRNLLTLAAHAACGVEEIVLRHPAFPQKHGSEGALKSLQLYARVHAHEEERAKRNRHELLFTYAQIGGAAGVAKWLTVARELRPALGSLMALRYAVGMYTENRLQNVTRAAEALHRIRFSNEVLPPGEHAARIERILAAIGEDDDRQWLSDRLTYSNEPALRRRLIELAEYAGTPFSVFVGNAKRWAFIVARSRNELAHFQGEEPEIEGLYYLAESVYVLVVMCILRMAGASDDLVGDVPNNQRVTWLSDHVKAAVKSAGDPGARST